MAKGQQVAKSAMVAHLPCTYSATKTAEFCTQSHGKDFDDLQQAVHRTQQ